MEEEIVFLKNDTYRSIESTLKHLKEWKDLNGGNHHANPRETALVITKLEEAMMWSLQMVKRD